MIKRTIEVKSYMLQKATPDFTFMKVWNNDIPMPDHIMTGIFTKETKGMVFAELENVQGVKWSGWVIKSAIIKDIIVGTTNSNKVIRIEIAKSEKIVGKDTSLFISFEYDADIVARIKAFFNERFYNPKTKVWELPLDELDTFKERFNDYQLEIIGKEKEKNKNKINLEEIQYKTVPYKHQEEAVQFGLENDCLGIFDEAGCGKSKTSLDIAINRKLKGEVKHCLIIAGVNSLKWNWKREVETHTNEKCYVLGEEKGSKASNEDKLDDLCNLDKLDSFFIVTNVESLRYNRKTGKKIRKGKKLVDEKVYMITDKLIDLIKRNEINMIIFDEAHVCRDSTSQSGTELLRLQPKYRIAMTGTPLVNNAMDLFIIFKWLGFEEHTLYAFRNHYCLLGGFNNQQIIGYKNKEELYQRLDSIGVRRLTKDILDLPEVTIVDEYVEMTDNQKLIYKEAKKELLDDMKKNIDKFKVYANALSQTIRLRQATGYTGVLSTKIQESAKYDRALEIIEEAVLQNKKIVVFSNWIQTLMPLYEKVSEKYNTAIITGEVKDIERMSEIDKFQNNKECKVMFGTVQAMGTGINLTAGSVEIFLDEPWTSAIEEQAIHRCYRIGQKNNILVYILQCYGTIDMRVRQIVKNKDNLSKELVDGVNAINYLIS